MWDRLKVNSRVLLIMMKERVITAAHSGVFNGLCYDSVAHRRKTYQAEDICHQDEG